MSNELQTGLICLELLANLNKMSVDSRAITRQFALTSAELSQDELMRVLKHAGFRAKLKHGPLASLVKQYPLPLIGVTQTDGYFLLLKANEADSKGLCFFPHTKLTEEKTYAELEASTQSTWIIAKPKQFNPDIRFGLEWFFAEILHYKRIIGEVLLGSFFVQLFGLVTPLFTQVIIDKVIVHHSLTTLDVLAFGFVAVIIFQSLLNFCRNYIFIHTANKLDAKLGAKLFNHLLALPFVYFEARKVGTIISRVRELETIREFLTNKTVSVVIDLIFSIVFVGMMLLYSWYLTLFVLGFVAIIATIYVLITPLFRRRLDEKFQMAAQSNSYLVEAVTGIQTVKSLAVEGNMQRQWEDYLARYVSSSFNLSLMNTVASTVGFLFQQALTIVTLYLGVKLVIDHSLSVGQLIAFNMLSGQFVGPVMRLVNLWQELQQALLAVDRLGDILNQPTEVQSSKELTLPKLKGTIAFNDVSFRYGPSGPLVLNKLSIEIEPGTMIGIVGRSGSGKSTITKLIQRLYLTQEGTILIDGMDIRHLNPLWLRYNIGVVLQDSFLFSGSIKDNIALPKPDASIDMILRAAQLAGAHEFISTMPEGYDTMVGERGSSLSGGQKQRIAIARALITNPKILIFDEATSALDYESERIIRDNLAMLRKDRTVIIIAHRLSTVVPCDRIYVVEQGQIIESGSHHELLSQKGYYHNLFEQQML